jgi:1,4-alpha-glucan branching enzyme
MLKKRIVEEHDQVEVVFEIPLAELPEGMKIDTIRVVGEFNNWDASAASMIYHDDDEAFRVTIGLKPGREYQFRYLLNDGYWCNDWAADKYAPNQFGEDNCVVVTPEIDSNQTENSEASST